MLNIHWKDWCWSWNSNTLAIWCEEPIHWKSPWCWERWKAEEKGMTEDEMVGWHQWLSGYAFDQTNNPCKIWQTSSKNPKELSLADFQMTWKLCVTFQILFFHGTIPMWCSIFEICSYSSIRSCFIYSCPLKELLLFICPVTYDSLWLFFFGMVLF